ncbi:hypothetical protein GCM10023074_31440 [Microbispora amethystogenes]|uniref:Uncharacterized protein n=1 Tax=Microbispora amethystogenes TaxID=1427754 RepID=A0ABQ4FF94_9ACTN|nr:hypothetical protein Mam01_35870 [Microbispora amethystogenes]
MAAELDELVVSFWSRPLDGGPYTFVRIETLKQKVCEGGRTINVLCLIATGVNADDSGRSSDWTSSPPRTGLAGVLLVTSDCHAGLRDVIAATPARCRLAVRCTDEVWAPEGRQTWR